MHKPALSLLAAALLLSAPLAQAQDNRFYVGAGFGRADYAGGLGGQIRSAYAGRSDFAVDAAALTDDSDQAWKFTFGYRFLPWLAAELVYSDAGEAASAYQLRSIVPMTLGTASLKGRYQLDGSSAALVGEWPLSDDFAVSLRAGVVASRLRYDERGTDAAGQPYAFHGPKDNTTGALGGLGVAWHMTPQWDLRLDWDRWFGIGNRFNVTATQNGHFDQVDLFTVNVFYRFGG